MQKLKSISFALGLLAVIFSSYPNVLFGQLALEKDIFLTEYPIYFDLLRNLIVEDQITDSYIVNHKVKSITQSFHYKKGNIDTILKAQRLNYEKSGRLGKRELFYYGTLFKTEYFSYTENAVAVHEESLENNNQRILSYEIQFDSLGNPIKYIRYEVYNHENGLDGLDSVTYSYTYNKRGDILIKKQHFHYRDTDEGRYATLIFEYTYNNQGQNTGYTVSEPERKLYSVKKEYSNGLLHKKNAVYSFYDGPKHFYDSTEYLYGKHSNLVFIKRNFYHDPLGTQPDDIFIQFIYDKNGFLSEKYPLAFKDDNTSYYKWEFYED